MRSSLVPLLLLLALAFPADGASVDGRLLDPAGKAVAGGEVTLRSDAGIRKASTAPDGSFRFDSVSPGSYILVASNARDAEQAVAHTLDLTSPQETAVVELQFPSRAYIDEITVFGTRIAAVPEQIPGAVTILDRQTLESARPMTTTEVLRKAPGVTVRDEEGFGLRPNIGIRGTNPTRSTKVLLLEDGIPLSYAPYGDNASYYHPPIDRFDTIEILKGSGQIAYGPQTIGGVINYLTPAPPVRPTFSALIAAGSKDYLNGHFSFGGSWGDTGLLVDYMRKEGGGTRQNTSSELDDINLKLVHSFSGRHSVTFRSNYYGEDSQVTYSGLRLAEFEADPYQNPFENDFFYGDRYGASLSHALRLNDSTMLTTTLYGSTFKRHWWRQSSNSNQRPNDASDAQCGGMANLLTTCGNEGRLREYRAWGIEPRLQWTGRVFGLGHTLETGVRTHLESQERLQINGETPSARIGRTVENNARDNTAYSLFVQDRITAGRWAITPGVRVERIGYERLNRLANNGAGARGETTLTEVVPGVGVAYHAGQVTLFAGAHRGFAPPRTEDIISNSGGVVDLDPELSWNYELGARGDVRPGLHLEATLFRMDYENQVIPASVAGGIGATLTNAGETLHEGIEIGARMDSAALFGTRHNVYSILSYTNVWEATYAGHRLSSVPGFTTVSVTGNRLPYVPEQTFTAGVGYMIPRGIDLFVEAVHVSEQFGDDLNTAASTTDGQRGLVPDYTIWNATVNFDVAPLRSTFFVTVKNVFDELYIADRTRGILPGPPRMVQAGLKYRY
jgi:Fe(3+) dicitrate transport protein